MKIERGYGEYNDRLFQANKNKSVQTSTLKTNSQKDDIDFSETTKKIRHTQKNEAIESARSEKIAALKQAIKDGTYQVSAEEITTSMLQAMKTPKDI
ncbi:flagellar biosynthesis anti-sigma factor FlgM [Enterococcus saccharolyticus]|uniref:Negative regulator of flagellin synthesis n=1 Tax=Candidatus Enterococcus willemsii TaxID=1857215 RepID=A0ABQ6YWV5_9ENTE|nr:MULTISPECIES: flagellar biosynthesis anti-sigma factor FlgM [Enterococcus]KAF1302037.1 flagellar biosynthesis anti-sigma factor FlgM [Enterococcus sp. CU12B]MCD5002855.1 flagellar biosynthesis anti-sigma factor FlgM [Enterococcus saccharolyticus]